ncbi:hypothetical protein A2303_06735 [Candidatus Falkowbacteria bacterium RIFOXYB2_FULL_47_14]|uniref:Uncharacterized protein n=1 Tax=Candidatus Falkowbacteria bacterium RIFOXYA2_FULL_47_19 TaxID=1797994 RepID=A0A1F5SG85_9BACT|nr:MAG: hypothetical protein A2227_00480 [Candidatus Falkowbacteria bacterium RIFOXYA2_FULL_47_19]OGF35525.1 MAG: hypothetical protein A2468_05795 [Candidatus Falkowbacteria bacterium RIFOXYC2_FULL_46_15]OGF43566.1 MAG: hypothetical protein A2303_06735 [Candidatus Falkowbacteria bacterium RIFOXYB2_FULL_47_14]
MLSHKPRILLIVHIQDMSKKIPDHGVFGAFFRLKSMFSTNQAVNTDYLKYYNQHYLFFVFVFV